MNFEFANYGDEEQCLSCHCEVNDFVLVQFPKKKGATEYYVGKFISKDSTETEFQIEFYKQLCDTNKFIKSSDEIFDVNSNDMVINLPPPVAMPGSDLVAA